MAAYPTLLDGMLGASQTTAVPRVVLDALLAPRVPSDPDASGRAGLAPLGLRRVEAALVAGGFDPAEVAVVTAETLPRAVGPGTRVVALSSGDPLGLGMNSNTMTAIAGGRSCTEALFRRLLADARALRRRFPRLRIVVGGPGAWQLTTHDDARRRLGIDLVLTGYCEGQVADVFRRLVAGEDVSGLVACAWTGIEHVRPIRGATVMGIVETSRGCGLACDFCTLARVPMVHFPAEFIARDVTTNVAAGVRNVGLISEDFFRYGGPAAKVNPSASIALLKRLREIPGLAMLQLDHANVSSVAGFSDAELVEIHSLLCGGYPRPVWVNLGVETASGRLLDSLSARAKMRPFDAASWADACREQVLRLIKAGFLPMVSLVVGLDGETDEDVAGTRRWVESLSGERVLVFPLLLAPTEPGRRPVAARDLTAEHWRLIDACYRFNFKWVPHLLWSEETVARVPLAKRLALAALARGNALWWKLLLAWRSS